MSKQYHIHLLEVEQAAALWGEPHFFASNREYVTYSGEYKDMPITCTNSGIGAPLTSIAVENLARVGATTFLRIGTCGTFPENVAACVKAAKKLGYSHHIRVTCSHDDLYAGRPKPGGSFNGFWQSDWKNHYQDLKRLNEYSCC